MKEHRWREWSLLGPSSFVGEDQMVCVGPVAGRCGGESLWELSSGSLYFLSRIFSKVLMGKLILEV